MAVAIEARERFVDLADEKFGFVSFVWKFLWDSVIFLYIERLWVMMKSFSMLEFNYGLFYVW